MVTFFDAVVCSEEEKPRNAELFVLGMMYLIIMGAMIYTFESISPVLDNPTYPFRNIQPPDYTFVP
jgi:hypothetical protein